VPSLADPCPGKRRQGRHQIRGNLCRACGARADGTSDPSIVVALDIAEDRFRAACDAFDATFGAPVDVDARLEITVEWRTALQALRAAEGAIR
jgi:hypothetical protein